MLVLERQHQSRILKKKTLFITPHNKLGQELRKDGCKSITFNKLLGIYGDGQGYANL